MERLENLKLQIAVIVIAEIVMLLVMYLVRAACFRRYAQQCFAVEMRNSLPQRERRFPVWGNFRFVFQSYERQRALPVRQITFGNGKIAFFNAVMQLKRVEFVCRQPVQRSQYKSAGSFVQTCYHTQAKIFAESCRKPVAQRVAVVGSVGVGGNAVGLFCYIKAVVAKQQLRFLRGKGRCVQQFRSFKAQHIPQFQHFSHGNGLSVDGNVTVKFNVFNLSGGIALRQKIFLYRFPRKVFVYRQLFHLSLLSSWV